MNADGNACKPEPNRRKALDVHVQIVAVLTAAAPEDKTPEIYRMRSEAAAHIGLLLHDFSAGGSERIAIRLANAWMHQGRRVSLICGSETGPLRELVEPSCEVATTAQEIQRDRASRRRLAPQVAKLVEALRPDLVFIPGNYHIPLIAPLFDLPHSPAVVVKLSNPIRRKDRRGLRRWMFEAQLRGRLRQIDTVVAMSPGLAEEARHVLRETKIVVIPQPTLADDLGVPNGLGASSSKLLVVGRLVSQKNIALAVKALALLPDRHTSLTILGEGPERQAISKLAEKLGIADRVTLAGYVPHIQPELQTARAMLLTSHFEGFPAVVVEALAAGVPVVSTQCSPAIAELLDDPLFGVIVASADARKFSDAIRSILEAPSPDPLRLAESVNHHRIGPIASAYLALFDSICADRANR